MPLAKGRNGKVSVDARSFERACAPSPEFHSVYSFEALRALRAEMSHYEGMELCYMQGFFAHNYPHRMIPDYEPSVLDRYDPEGDAENAEFLKL